jgi:hypothetical protein
MQFFKEKLTYSLFYLQLFYRPLTGELASKKVSFVVSNRVFEFAIVSNRCALTPAVRRFFFANAPHVLIMFWHDFGRREGGKHHGHHVCARSLVGSLLLFELILLNKKYLMKKVNCLIV